MILKRISVSTAEPVTLTEMKLHLRVDATSEDILISGYISAAREQAENKLHRALIPQQWKKVIDDFPGDTIPITLPFPPLSTAAGAVTVTYTKDDTAASSTTVPSSAITIDRDSEPCRIFPSGANEWPSDVATALNSVNIVYDCGYKTPPSDVPSSVKTWIMVRTAAMYENREAVVMSQFSAAVAELPRAFVDGFLDRYVVDEVV